MSHLTKHEYLFYEEMSYVLEHLFFSMDMEESEKTISEVKYLVWTKKKMAAVLSHICILVSYVLYEDEDLYFTLCYH